jgi:hypothetical protein
MAEVVSASVFEIPAEQQLSKELVIMVVNT